MELILASKSPRRQELFALVGLRHTVIVSDVEENAPAGLAPDQLVEYLAKIKAEAVFAHHRDACVVGADTVVHIDGEIIGKPKNEEDAKRILRKLSGRSHTVYSGLAVLTRACTLVAHEATKVTFASITQEEIDWYVSTGEPLDKAGAYGIQGPGGIFVDRVEGNYFNVIGLPLPPLYRMLKKAGVWEEAIRG